MPKRLEGSSPSSPTNKELLAALFCYAYGMPPERKSGPENAGEQPENFQASTNEYANLESQVEAPGQEPAATTENPAVDLSNARPSVRKAAETGDFREMARDLLTDEATAKKILGEILHPKPEGPEEPITKKNGISIKQAAKESGVSYYRFKDIFREWFGKYSESQGSYIHKGLAEVIKRDIEKLKAPKLWKTENQFAKELGVTTKAVKRVVKTLAEEDLEAKIDLNEHMRTAISNGPKGEALFISPVQQARVEEKLASEGKLTVHDEKPGTWITVSELAKELKQDPRTVQRNIEKYPELAESGVGVFHIQSRKASACVSRELADMLRGPEGGIPVGFKDLKQIEKETGRTENQIKVIMRELSRGDENTLNQSIRQAGEKTFVSGVIIDKIREISENWTPNGEWENWKTTSEIAAENGATFDLVGKLLDGERDNHPEWFRPGWSRSPGGVTTYISPEAESQVVEFLQKYPEAAEGWKPDSVIAKELGTTSKRVMKLAEEYGAEHPEWTREFRSTGRGGGINRHRSEELVGLIRSVVEAKSAEKTSMEKVEGLKGEVVNFLREIEQRESLEAKEFIKLAELFGGERVVDLLYQLHPEYTKVPMPYVRSILPDYLGEFLTVKGQLNLDNLEAASAHLENPLLQEGLREVVKNDCLHFYNESRRLGVNRSDLEVIDDYIANIRQRSAEYASPKLTQTLDSVREFYRSAIEDYPKSAALVDSLRSERAFPDLNQLINIKEISDNRKMLIGDEMGLGKSASAILAKETLGVDRALIVVPSNVSEVWQAYLSDRVDPETGEQVGYFKSGQAPKVLVIGSLDELKSANPDDYDYLLLSHERLTEEYTTALERLEPGMLIVDEVHKLKNLSQGKRAESLLRLADKIQGDEQYLALLSGTPVPNKVEDVAMILKLLYPERFMMTDNAKLTHEILRGDVIDLRNLLVPRMELKELGESIDMPTLNEELIPTEFNEREREIYEVLMEEDELTASQKLQTLRQFILNPELIEAAPELESSKITEVGAALKEAFESYDRIVLFANGYIEGVLRGESSALDKFNLPPEISIRVIDGSTSKEARLEIQNELKHSSGKLLVAVSGQTADVGVDFSGAQQNNFYNEPWTEFDRRQQLARVYRPGLESDLTSRTFYVKDSIEEGIHRYIEQKYLAIDKLLHGIPLSEIEKTLVSQDERAIEGNLEVDPELASYYFSSWDRMLKIWGYVKELGEPDFAKFLTRYGREYADCYTDLSSRSYQANAARLSASIIAQLAKDRNQAPQDIKILDIASGPEMLRRHVPNGYEDQVFSLDINRHHFEQPGGARMIGSFLQLPVADKAVDFANLSMALHYTSYLPSKQNFERVQLLQELNRVLKNGGQGVVLNIYSWGLRNPDTFNAAVEKMGFKIVEDYTGRAQAGHNFDAGLITLEKTADCTQNTKELMETFGTEGRNAFKSARRNVSLRDSRKFVTEFVINGTRQIKSVFNSKDQEIYDEEQALLSEMDGVKADFGGINQIPVEVLRERGLTRFFTGKNYVLFKRLTSSAGVVITR